MVIKYIGKNKGEKMFCVKCGTENEDHAKFCKKCGNALDYNAQKVTGDTFISEPVYLILSIPVE